jgi:hypothetical protein
MTIAAAPGGSSNEERRPCSTRPGLHFALRSSSALRPAPWRLQCARLRTSHPNIAVLTAHRTGRSFMRIRMAFRRRSCGRLASRVVRCANADVTTVGRKGVAGYARSPHDSCSMMIAVAPDFRAARLLLRSLVKTATALPWRFRYLGIIPISADLARVRQINRQTKQQEIRNVDQEEDRLFRCHRTRHHVL